ncbi:hypothetical protein GA0115259_1046310 [Streptomyces sp. MnatMP-M17]|nr:hypothetical protein GA0115259_1046310 [Streptomyces sp. MnatMP-M17]
MQSRAVGGDGLLRRLGDVLPQMKAIGHLRGLGRGGSRRVRVSTGTVTADDLDLRVPGQPRNKRGRVPLGQQIQYLVRFGVDDHGSVDVPPAECEVVHADGPRMGAGRVGQVHHAAKERAAARRDPHALSETGTGPAGQGQPDGVHRRTQPLSGPAVPPGQARYLLGERPPRTRRTRAGEPPHAQSQHHTPSRAGQVRRKAQVGAVHPLRPAPALRTGGTSHRAPGLDMNLPAARIHGHDRHTRDRRKQQLLHQGRHLAHDDRMSATPAERGTRSRRLPNQPNQDQRLQHVVSSHNLGQTPTEPATNIRGFRCLPEVPPMTTPASGWSPPLRCVPAGRRTWRDAPGEGFARYLVPSSPWKTRRRSCCPPGTPCGQVEHEERPPFVVP